jgi:hypothetical protein
MIKNENELFTSSDVAGTDTFVGPLVQRIFKDTIAEQICDIQPCYSPSGAVYASKRDGTKWVTMKRDFTVDEIKVAARFSHEWFQDFTATYKKNGKDFLFANVSEDAKDQIDSNVIDMLNAMATPTATLTLANTDAETEGTKILSKINTAVYEMAIATKRGTRPFVIVSYKVASLLSTAGMIAFQESDNTKNRDFVGRIGRTMVFMDINATTDYVLVGHKGYSMGDSSVIVAPYISAEKLVEDYSVDESAIVVINRVGLVRTPLDESTGDANSHFATKIPVDFTAFTSF